MFNTFNYNKDVIKIYQMIGLQEVHDRSISSDLRQRPFPCTILILIP